MKTLTFYPPYDISQIDGLEQLSALTNEELNRHKPDIHMIALNGENVATARCSLWHTETPGLPEQKPGIIGHYAAKDPAAAAFLLAEACALLSKEVCTLAIGPMDGNTWRRYRFVTEHGSTPRFFLELENPDEWPQHFLASGFTPLATYSSALTTDLTYVDPRMAAVEERLTSDGVTIRPIEPTRFETELFSIFQLSLEGFQHNYLYTPAEASEFLGVYRQALPYVRPELVLMAEQSNRLVGFSFSIPDWCQKERGEPVDTIVYKTIAVLPGRAYAGLGSLLSAQTNRTALKLGYSRVIHALMHDSNHSRKISDRFAHTIRRYTLFAKSLQP